MDEVTVQQNYFIKEGYKCNLDESGAPIELYTEVPASRVYQVPVYKYAQHLIKYNDINSVLELGSGSGYKLIKYIYPIINNVTGVDQGFAIDYCKRKYNVGEWVVDNFDKEVSSIDKKFDLIISADVIEHIIDPTKLLNKIKQYATHDTHIIVSTPERDLVRGFRTYGPPPNRLHVREWNKKEFADYITDQGFEIMNHSILDAASMKFHQKLKAMVVGSKIKNCQMVHCMIKK